jgi:hypothetical protein
MASSYPGAVDSFTTKATGETVEAAHVNDLQNAIVAVQTELGADPAGSAATVLARLAVSLAADGDLTLTGVSTLTISGGSITVTGNRHIVDTESAAASDSLDTINGGAAGLITLLRIANDGRNVTITQAGNILTQTGGSVTLDITGQVAILVYDAGLSKWLCLTTAGFIIQTGNHYFAGGQQVMWHDLSANTTLDNTYFHADVDAAGGAVTITLPTAVGCAGQTFEISRINSGSNNVTVDGDGSETINGVATYVLTAQYQTVTVRSTGAGWRVV